MNLVTILAFLSLVLFVGTLNIVASTEIHEVEVVNSYLHDREAFTQGLLYAGNGTLFESTGLYGKSSVRKVDLKTGKIEAIHKMDPSFFGEGLTLLGNRLFQLLWRKNTGFVYDIHDMRQVGVFKHEMSDGWGLTTDGHLLFGTDGSSMLYLIDPQTFKVVDKRVVSYGGRSVRNLNELEFVNGEIWANIWQSNCIVRLGGDGTVIGWIVLEDLPGMLTEAGHRDFNVLNGVAWDPVHDRIYVTGKLWPKLFEIRLRPSPMSPDDVARSCTVL